MTTLSPTSPHTIIPTSPTSPTSHSTSSHSSHSTHTAQTSYPDPSLSPPPQTLSPAYTLSLQRYHSDLREKVLDLMWAAPSSSPSRSPRSGKNARASGSGTGVGVGARGMGRAGTGARGTFRHAMVIVDDKQEEENMALGSGLGSVPGPAPGLVEGSSVAKKRRHRRTVDMTPDPEGEGEGSSSASDGNESNPLDIIPDLDALKPSESLINPITGQAYKPRTSSGGSGGAGLGGGGGGGSGKGKGGGVGLGIRNTSETSTGTGKGTAFLGVPLARPGLQSAWSSDTIESERSSPVSRKAERAVHGQEEVLRSPLEGGVDSGSESDDSGYSFQSTPRSGQSPVVLTGGRIMSDSGEMSRSNSGVGSAEGVVTEKEKGKGYTTPIRPGRGIPPVISLNSPSPTPKQRASVPSRSRLDGVGSRINFSKPMLSSELNAGGGKKEQERESTYQGMTCNPSKKDNGYRSPLFPMRRFSAEFVAQTTFPVPVPGHVSQEQKGESTKVEAVKHKVLRQASVKLNKGRDGVFRTSQVNALGLGITSISANPSPAPSLTSATSMARPNLGIRPSFVRTATNNSEIVDTEPESEASFQGVSKSPLWTPSKLQNDPFFSGVTAGSEVEGRLIRPTTSRSSSALSVSKATRALETPGGISAADTPGSVGSGFIDGLIADYVTAHPATPGEGQLSTNDEQDPFQTIRSKPLPEAILRSRPSQLKRPSSTLSFDVVTVSHADHTIQAGKKTETPQKRPSGGFPSEHHEHSPPSAKVFKPITPASTRASSGDAIEKSSPKVVKLFRSLTFQRPHHKNGRGKGRGGDWTAES